MADAAIDTAEQRGQLQVKLSGEWTLATLPLPLAALEARLQALAAQPACWDLQAIEKSARISAIEASAEGIHWTFSPMVDIARDARWGRISEGAGEDVYLGSLIAKVHARDRAQLVITAYESGLVSPKN